MKRMVRTIGAMGFLVFATLALGSQGCETRLGPVTARQNSGINRSNLPNITVEHAQDCVAVYGSQLPAGHHAFHSNVEMHEDGAKVAVRINDIPNTASDFGGCMRKAFADMPVSADLVRKGAVELKSRREQASAAQRTLVGSPVVIVVAGVVIVVSELVLEAGAYTIMFAVTVKVVEKAKDDVVDVLKRIPITGGDDEKDNCAEFYAACIGNAASKARGNHWNITVCGSCAEVCKHEGAWPSTIPIFGKGNVSCY